MSRVRVAVLVVASLVVVVAGGFGVRALQVRQRESARAAALKRYTSQVGPPTRSLYRSWNAFQASIGRPQGSDELAVKAAYDSASQLQRILEDTDPPAGATLFDHELSDIVKNVLVVIDSRVRLAITGPQADESGIVRDPEAQRRDLQIEAGNAFYFVKQTFPDAIAQLTTLERSTY